MLCYVMLLRDRNVVTYRYRHPTEYEIHGMYENKIQIQTMNQIKKTITYRILRYNYNINLSCFFLLLTD